MPLPEQDILQTADVLAQQREPGFETEGLPSPNGFTAPQIAPIPIPGTGQTMGGTSGSQEYLTKFNQDILGTKDKLTPGNLPGYTAEDVYNPRYRSVLPGEDSEEAFAKGQNGFKQFGNALVKFGATAVGTFLEGMAALPNTISSINGNSPYDTTLGNNLDQWKENLEDKFPNYYTKWEKEHPFASAAPFTQGFANFWGDKFIKNLGFTVGAIGSAVLTDLAVGFATEGLGEIPLIGQQIGRVSLWLNKVFTGSNRAEELISLGRAAGRTGEQLLDLKKLSQAAAATKVSNGARYAVNLYGATASEAGFEARDGYNTVKGDLMKAYQRENGYSPTGADLADIEKYAKAAGNVRFGVNMALLSVSNALQLDAILKPFSAAKAGVRSTIQRELETGASIELSKGSIDTFERASKSLWGKIRPIVPSVLSEGVFEEGGQFAAQIATENFYERKYLYDKGLSKSQYTKDETPFDSRDHIGNIVHSVIRGFADEFGTDEGLENVVLGGLTGAAFGGITRFMDRNKNKQLTQTILNLLNSQGVTGVLSNQYDEAASSQRISEDMKEAVKSNDIFKYKNFQHEQFTKFVLSGIKAGRFDVRMAQLDMLRDMDNDEFKKAFGLDKTTDNVKTAAEYIDTLKDKAEKIKRSYDIINDTFINPFKRNSKATTKEEALEAKKYETFETWKQDLTFVASINADTSQRIESIGRDLRGIYANLDQYHVANFTDRAYLKSYANQMDTEVKGLESLIKQGVSSDPKADEKRIRSLNSKSASIHMILSDGNPSPKKFEELFGKLLNYHLNGQNDGGVERVPQEILPKLIEYGKDIHRLRKYRESANQAFDKLSTEEGFNRYFREAEIADEKYAEKNEKKGPAANVQAVTTGQTITPKPPVQEVQIVPTVQVKNEKGEVKLYEEGKEHFVALKQGENPQSVKIIRQNQDGSVTVEKADGTTEDVPSENFFAKDPHAEVIKNEVDSNTSSDDIPPNTQAVERPGDKKKDMTFSLYSTTDPVYSRLDVPFNNFHRRHQNFLFDMASSDPDVFNQDNKPRLRIIPVTGKTAQALGFPTNFIQDQSIPTKPNIFTEPRKYDSGEMPKISIDDIDIEKSFGSDDTFENATIGNVKIVETRGVNYEGYPVGTVLISGKFGENFFNQPYEVHFKKNAGQTSNVDNGTIRAVYVIDDTIDPVARKRQKDAILRGVKNRKGLSDMIKGQFEANPEQAISEYYQQATKSQTTSATGNQRENLESRRNADLQAVDNAKAGDKLLVDVTPTSTEQDSITGRWTQAKVRKYDYVEVEGVQLESPHDIYFKGYGSYVSRSFIKKSINAKYDAEIAILEQTNQGDSSNAAKITDIERRRRERFETSFKSSLEVYDNAVEYARQNGTPEKLKEAEAQREAILQNIIKADIRSLNDEFDAEIAAIGSSTSSEASTLNEVEKSFGENLTEQIIEYGSQGLYFTNAKGEKMGKVGDQVDPNQAIFTTFATTALKFEDGTDRYTNKEGLDEAAAVQWWRETRADILGDITKEDAIQRTYDFAISRGIPLIINEKSKNNPIDVGLIRAEDLDKSIITIPTLGEVSVMGAYNEEGEGIASIKTGIKMPPGTPLLNYGGSLNYLNARLFNKAEAENIFEILKIIADRSRSSETTPLFKYLHKVIHMANPEKNIKATNSSITVSGPNLFLGTQLSPIDMIPAALENSKEKIIDFLLTAHHSINNSELLKIKNDPRSNELEFAEIKVVDGQITVPNRWKNYNHYLLSNKTPDNRARIDAPLTVNLAVPQAGERPIIQKYSVIQSFDFDPSKFKVVQSKPATAPIVQPDTSTISGSEAAINQVMNDIKPLGVSTDNLDKLRFEYETSTEYTQEEAEYLMGAVDFIKDKLAEAKKQQGVKQQAAQPEKAAIQQPAPRELEYIELGGNKLTFNVLARDANGNITDLEALGILKDDNTITPFNDKEKGKALILKTLGESQIKEDETTDPDDDEGLGAGGFTQAPDRYRVFNAANNKYKKADLNKEFAEVKGILPDWFQYRKVDSMLRTTGGGYAWGALRDNMIYIYRNAEVGTTYHEAFEAVWYHFVTGKEQQGIYDEFTSRKGEFTTFENKKKNFSDASVKEAKEQLAEEFRDYRLTGKLPIQKKQRNIFQRLLDFIKRLIGMDSSERNSLFKKMNKGYYRNYATSLRGPMISPEYSYYREPGLEDFNETIVQDMLQGMTAQVFGRLFGENSQIIDQLEKDFKTTAGALYDKLKEELTSYFEDKTSRQKTLTAEYGVRFQAAKSDDDKAALIAQVKSIRKEWTKVKNNWQSFVREHMRYLRTFNIEFIIDDEGEQHFVDQTEVEDPNKSMSDYDRDITQIDAKNSASTRVKLLIASIADSEWIKEATKAGMTADDSVRSKRESSSMALPKLVQYAKLFNYLLHNSAGINGIYGIWRKFSEITDAVDTRKPVDANMRKLMSRVTFDKGFEGKTQSDARLVLSLENTLTKQKPNFFRQFVDYLKDTYFRTTVLNSKINQVKSTWIANIKGSSAIKPSAENRFVFVKDVASITNNIEFLNKLGIEITQADYKRLRGKRIQNFNDEVNSIRTLIQQAAIKGTPIPIISSKQIDFNGRLNGLAELYVTYMVGDDTQSQHPNLDNDPTSNFILNNVVSTILNDVNDSASRDEFIEKPNNQYFRDAFHEDSILLNKILFDFNTGKKSKVVEVGIVEGRETWDSNNKATSKLVEAERQLYEINNNLNGVFYTLLPADAKTEWAINVGTYVSADGFFGDSNSRGNEISNFSNQMYRWLQTEILLAQDYENRRFIDNLTRIPKGETRPVGKSLRFFKNILPKDVVNDINAKVIDGDSALEDVLSSSQMRALMSDFVMDKTNRTLENLLDWNVLTPKANGKYKLYGFDKTITDKYLGKKNEYTQEELQKLIMFREMNYIINNIEMHKFFFGDPAQYTDELKRIKTFLSGREYTHVDMLNTSEGFNQWAEVELNKTAEGQDGISLSPEDPGYQTFKNHFNTVSLKDVFFESNHMEELEEAIGKSASSYGEGNENDGGAYMMGVAYREMMWRAGGRFTQAQEDHFQWEMAWERYDKFKDGKYTYSSNALRKHDEEILEKEEDTEVSFPILKLMHSGVVNTNGIGVASIDKASWAPLFYRWYKGKGLEKIYDAAQKRGIDYFKMESAHKVGMQKRSTMSLYNEKGEINVAGFDTIVPEMVPMKLIGIQVEQAKKEKGQTEGSQLRKIALSDLLENGVPIDFMPNEKNRQVAFDKWSNIENDYEKVENSRIYGMVLRHNEALINLTLARTQGAMKRMGMIEQNGEMTIPDKKLISDFILAELERRELPRNIAASIQISPETRDFSNPLEANPQYAKIRSIIYSILEKTITRPKVNGGQKTMLSVTGFESGNRIVKKKVNGKDVYTSDTLKFYKQGKDGTEACEVILPYWFGKKLMEAESGKTKEEVIEHLNDTEEGQKLLMGIGFRIPTQGLNSVDFFIVKDFLPEQMGDVVVMPSQITVKAGSDFDIDKLNVYLRNFYIDGKTGLPKTIDYKGSEKDTKEYILKLIQAGSIKANSIRKDLERYISEETEGFEEGGLFESIPGTEELFSNDKLIEDFLQDKEINTLNMYYQKTLENEYFDSIQDILSLKENFSRLVQPNDASELKKYRNEMLKLKGGDTIALGDYGKLLDSTFMMQERQAYMASKQVVGISAVSQTAHTMGQMIQGGLVVTDPAIVARFPHNEVDGKISLSGLSTADGGLISNINSQTTDGGVDVAKDKFLAEMGINQDTLSTFLTLVRMGAKPWWAILFLNQPSIQSFLKIKAISRSVSDINPVIVKENDRTLIAQTMNQFGGVGKNGEKIGNKPKEYTMTEMQDMIKAYSENPKSLTERQKIVQMMILDDYKVYNGLSWDLFHLYQGYNWDTARINDPNLVRLKQLKFIKANNLAVTPASKLLNDTFIGTMKDEILKLDQALRSVMNVQHGAAGELLNEFARTVFMMGGGEAIKQKMLMDIEYTMVDFCIQTGAGVEGRPLNTLTPLLITSKRPVAEYILALKRNEDKKISENPLLKALQPIIDKRTGYPSIVLMPERDYDTYTSNVLTDSFRELKNDEGVIISIDDNPDNNKSVAQIAKRLALLSIIQGGAKSGRGQFTHLVPSEMYTEYVRSSLVNMNLEGFTDNLVIHRTGWANSNLVPFAEAEYLDERDQLEGVPPILMKIQAPEIINTLAQIMNVQPEQVPTILTPKEWQYKRYKVIKVEELRRDPGTNQITDKTIRIFRRVDVETIDGTQPLKYGESKRLLFVEINAWGDSNIKEFYQDASPSVLPTNNHVIEVADEHILYAIEKASVPNNASANAIGEAVAKFEDMEPSDMDDTGNEPIEPDPYFQVDSFEKFKDQLKRKNC